jgi:diguanylate cyclase
MFPREREQQRNLLLIFIDLDDFKAINDRFGHPCGDSF